MSWAVAVCIDLTCVMAARERQRDKQQGVVTRRLSWPTVVLAGGVLLSLAANLAQAQPTTWGRIVAAVPPAAFLVAVSMIERRAARRPRAIAGEDGAVGEPSWRGRGAPDRRAAGRRRAPGPARAADNPRRAARPPRRVQPGRLRAAASAPRRGGPAAGSLPRRLTRLPPRAGRRPWPAAGRRAAARQTPRRRGNLPGPARRPRAGRLEASTPVARSATGPPADDPGKAEDGQQKWQTVYPGPRTCHPSMSLANTGTSGGTAQTGTAWRRSMRGTRGN
jgi:hypothetical protein